MQHAHSAADEGGGLSCRCCCMPAMSLFCLLQHSALRPRVAQRPEARHVCGITQGALDGGLNVPHSEKRFVGYNRDDKSLDADTLRKFIYGGHVADYMNEMEVRSC